MLRRYNSKSLDTILLKNRRTTIGSAATCDVVVKGKGIAPVHASIQSTSLGFLLRDHSLSGSTRVNDRPVVGQVEIQSGDSLQVGGSPPFVFDAEWMFGTRPNSAKSKEHSVGGSPAPPTSANHLPIIGKRIIPLAARGSPTRKPERSSASSTESNREYYNSGRSIGNNLLQRVVKLQAEVIAKDEKIRQLTSSSCPHFQPTLPPSFTSSLPPPLPFSRRRPSKLPELSTKSFELFAYRAFVGAIASQLRQFNDRVLRNPQRDGAELFTAMCRAVDVPLSHRITDIEKHCEAVLIDNDFEDGDELISRLDNFIRESRREKILELTNELEMVMPLIRDAASNARENIKVCNVFTQWSRQFGDLLRKSSFSASVLFQAIDDLKAQFSEAHMSRHWLPPSITPILRLAALELEKRDGAVSPRAEFPTVPVVGGNDRKKSIDMTLDTCISQVEAIVHEIDYHAVRLFNKAKDYSTFQPLDLDSVTRISKVVDSMRSSIDVLSEHSFKDRPNSVLFFEITNEDIRNSMRKSDGEGSTSSLSSHGSGPQRKVSAAPKITDPLSESDEIAEERMMDVVERITRLLGPDEGPARNEGTISVDASVLKLLLQQSNKLADTYESLELDREGARRKRSIPPMITVEEESPEGPEPPKIEQIPSESPLETPMPIEDSPDATLPPTPSSETSEVSDDGSLAARTPESEMSLPDPKVGAEEEEEEEEEVPRHKKSLVAVMTLSNDSKILKKSYSEDLGIKKKTNGHGISRAPQVPRAADPTAPPESPPPSPEATPLIDDESDEDPEDPEEEEEEEEEGEGERERNPFTDDEKSTVRYVPKNESQELSPQVSQETSGDQERISSHLRSHINTANGKPHVTYQYPIRKYYSPPMKRRSKSEDQKIKETLSNRPPFVLY
ncbi:unnamed protein product [Caenorhabditis sp. 36 PRJEB53466]|nr:unnamed protein product [Caenorhabditis sp. 36 PRJEB53466]